MKITDSQVAMAAAWRKTETLEEKESLQIIARKPQKQGDRVEISQEPHIEPGYKLGKRTLEFKGDLRHSLKALIVEMLTGRRVETVDPSSLEGCAGEGATEGAAEEVSTPETGNGSGWGLIYEHSQTYAESQEVTVAGTGVVHTADGREIAFQMELNMSREFVEHHQVNVRAGDAALVDPLVLNFGGKAAELSDFRFAFDLDGDGTDDDMPGLTPGSGYLALDRDENGTIDDGSELFGPGTGSGFQELAAYDEDKNGWIDEGDGIFEKLSLWEVDVQGERLISLKDRGVGAVFLGSLEAPFDLKDETNQLEGRIARHGLFLEEDGTAGTVQELDVRV